MFACNVGHDTAPVGVGPLSLPRRCFRSSVGARRAMATPENQQAEVNARGGEQQVVREYPEPLADVQRGEKGHESGNQVEIGQCIVEKLGQP